MNPAADLSRTRATRSWIALWLAVAIVPLLPYAWPLAQQATGDTPLAYLVWVPPIAFGWAVWALRDHPPYNNDAETNFLLGSGIVGIVGAVLATGPTIWPYSFVGQDMGLAVWPLWGLGTAWLVFGVTVTPRIAAPLAYLALSWPPPVAWVIARTQGILTAAALAGTRVAAGSLHWLSAGAQGTFYVQHGSTAVPVVVSAACSGADSVLAVAIVLPVVLTQFHGSLSRKMVLLGFGAVLALALNWLRLGLLILAVHVWGSYMAFDQLHPVLGFVLFALLVLILVRLALALRLVPRSSASPFATLQGPSLASGAIAVAAAAIVTYNLLPLVYARSALPGTPIAAQTADLTRIAPKIPGFRRVLLGRFNDASILGTGSGSIAYAYSTPAGAYVLAQVFETPNLSALNSYTYANCVAYHGDRIVATLPFLLGPRLIAQEYGVLLPPTQLGQQGAPVADAEWTLSMRKGGQTIFLRIALSTPPQKAAYWESRYFAPYRSPTGLLAMQSSPATGAMPRTLAVSAQVLRQFAADYEAALVRTAGR